LTCEKRSAFMMLVLVRTKFGRFIIDWGLYSLSIMHSLMGV